MRVLLSFIITTVLVLASSCTTIADKKELLDLSFKITNDYLLLPVEDRGAEFRMEVEYPGAEKREVIVVRLAQEKIDYWVKLDVKAYRGSTVKLHIEGISDKALGVKSIRQSDKPEFDYKEQYRPVFHFTPETGWMNDPNGMVYFDGEFHLFYQYNPYGNRWQNMHWGHAVSTDLVSWTYLPVALAPDSLGAVFSGSAVVDVINTAGFGKNAMVAIYTSAGKVQSQSIAYSTDRGRTFTKYDGNPVIPNQGITDFRDPKVMWHANSGQWVMSLATKQTITFYGSPDLKNWNRLSEFGNGIGSHAGVWECPDLFPLEYMGQEKWVLLVSINPGGPNHGSATQYFIGNFDGKTFVADPLPYPLWLDYGRDNYAGVTWSNVPESDGRRIFIGWMSNWDYANDVPTQLFRSATTVPRELGIVNNGKHLVVSSNPVEELKSLRGKQQLQGDKWITDTLVIEKITDTKQGVFEVQMNIKPENAKVFGFSLANAEGELVRFVFDLHQGSVMVDRTRSGKTDFHPNFASVPYAPLPLKKLYKIKLLVDKASSELFIDDGELVLTNIHFPTSGYSALRFFTTDNAWKAEGIKVYELR